MSMPTRGTTFGEIEVNGETYKIFSRPLSDEIAEKIHKYKKQNNGLFTSAPWLNDTYGWSIVDNKLYLNVIKIRFNNGEQITKKIPEAGEELLKDDNNSASIEVKTKIPKELVAEMKSGLLDNSIDRTPEEITQILSMRFGLLDDSSDRTLEEIGQVLNVTRERVSQISSIDSENIIEELFNTDRIFADWQNEDIKLLLKQEIHHSEIVGRRDHIIRNSRVLKFKDGVLISTHDEVDEFTTRSLKNYIEE